MWDHIIKRMFVPLRIHRALKSRAITVPEKQQYPIMLIIPVYYILAFRISVSRIFPVDIYHTTEHASRVFCKDYL